MAGSQGDIVSTVKRASSVLGLTGFVAVLTLLGGSAPVGGVMAALNAETDSTVSASGATWSIVVNGTSGAKTISLPAALATCTSFTLDNNGNANMASATTTATVNVTNTSTSATAGRPRIFVYGTSNCTGTSTSINPGSNTNIAKSTSYPRPTTAGTSTTWSFKRRDSNACTLAAPGCRVTISVTVSSADIAAGTTTNG